MTANDKTRAIAVEAKRDFPAAEVEIIGAWVWLTFEDKPSGDVRDDLKGRGFRWNPKRGQWSHNCGVPRKGARLPYHPREKYGTYIVTDPESVSA